MLRVGIIACRDYWKKGCPGYQDHILCFLALEKNEGPLGRLGEVGIAAMQPCPGCPGDGRISLAVKMAADTTIDLFVFPSCLFFQDHCPTAPVHAAAIEKATGHPVLLGSYLEATAARSCTTISLKPDDIPSINECRRHLLNLRYLHHLYERHAAVSRNTTQALNLLRMI